MSADGSNPKNSGTPFDDIGAETSARMETLFAEFKAFETEQHKRAVEMVDEGARFVKASMEYGVKLSDEWRKMAVETHRRALQVFSSPRWF